MCVGGGGGGLYFIAIQENMRTFDIYIFQYMTSKASLREYECDCIRVCGVLH